MDQYREVTRTGCLRNILNSFIAAVLGVLLFFGSFFVLWFNEGRINLATTAQRSVAMDSASLHAELDGKLVAATGQLASGEELGDGELLEPGSYLQVMRRVEMYAWEEDKQTTSHKEIGGSTRNETTYTYRTEWTASPASSSSFKVPNGHSNPSLPLQGTTQTASALTLGAYSVDPGALTFPDARPLSLDADTVQESQYALSGDYLLSRREALTNPKVGDLRISYQVVPSPIKVTLFGMPQGDRLAAYQVKGDTMLYRAFDSDRATAIKTLDTEYRQALWLFRGLGFLMMWFGLMMAFGPITAVFNILPIAGSASGCLIGVASFVVALVLSAVTVLISLIFHNLILLIIVLALIVGGMFLLRRMRGQRPLAMG
jgi:hypothetical protein